ncbi:monocarboxylate transporter-like protein [Trypanosoma brucei equiperdum]|uniref:Riboflavin transporter RibJ n=2 Tax=Trypanosoma brucei TaxID=5691 RepID=B2ZWD7_TRYB2|nr:monocarboxylate transporter-like protein [Trypanosoma brucei equiperdum]CAQ55525.1 transporter, putative [Trypanosoma brucei brucei TREU927]
MLPSFTRKPADHPIGYLVALSGLLMQLMSYGIDNSYSIFSEDMHNDPSLGFPSITAISLGNSVSLGLSPAFGVLAGFCVDRLPPRFMMALSTILLFTGLWISSTLAANIYVVTFTYCLFASIGTACMLSPGAAATSSWFNRYQGLAMGINFAGGGIGSAIIPPLAGKWVVAYGWRKAFQLMSIFCAIGVLATALSARRREPKRDDSSADDETREGNKSGNGSSVTRSNEPATVGGGGAANNGHNEGKEDVREMGRKNGSHTNTSKVPPNGRGVGTNQQNGNDGEGLDVTEQSQRNNTFASAIDVDMDTSMDADEPQVIRSLHTHKLTPWELFLSMFTLPFMGNFLCWFIYSWAFYSLIYAAVPYISSMGKPGTVYAGVPPIPTDVAATLFTFYGVFQVVGSVLVGWLASLVTAEFAYVFCATVGGIGCGLLALGRSYVAFALLLCIIGFCMAGMFAVMPTLIATHLYGPNLGFYFGAVFLAGVVGGFVAPPMQATIQLRNNGSYAFVCVVMSVSMTLSALVCYATLWRSKRSGIVLAARKTKLVEIM